MPLILRKDVIAFEFKIITSPVWNRRGFLPGQNVFIRIVPQLTNTLVKLVQKPYCVVASEQFVYVEYNLTVTRVKSNNDSNNNS